MCFIAQKVVSQLEQTSLVLNAKTNEAEIGPGGVSLGVIYARRLVRLGHDAIVLRLLLI